MADGVDGAADAFRTAIAPGSQPRDTGGRFASTPSRPETMFNPRPIEGDPLTGDTRDGGEDARLAAAERRIADGRAEEGDENVRSRARRAPAEGEGESGQRSLQRRGEERSDAAADVGYNDNSRAANDNGERGRKELQNSDHDGTNVDAAAEANGRDAEGNALSDAEAGQRYEITVDGQAMEVSLAEALKGYIREQTFRSRLNKVAEARQAVEHEAQNVVQLRDAYVQRLEYMHRTLAELTPPQPDWDREFALNPQAAHDKQKAYAQIYSRMQGVANAMQQEADARAQEYDQNAQKYAINQFTQFVQDANIPDEKALTAEMSRMRSYGKMRGFAEGELATVYDKRMLLVLRDAALYHQSTADQPKPVAPGKGKALIPGVATPTGTSTRRHIDDAQRQLAQTGRLDDAAALFQRLIR